MDAISLAVAARSLVWALPLIRRKKQLVRKAFDYASQTTDDGKSDHRRAQDFSPRSG